MNFDDTMEFYKSRYSQQIEIVLTPGKKLFLGNRDRPRRCRFCGIGEPEVTFNDKAHALPASFGNTTLFSYHECDRCNHLFGEGIENDLGNWSKPMRTLSRIAGRNGVPTIKESGDGKGWRVESIETGFRLTDSEVDPKFTIDDAKKELRFTLQRDPYRPLAALKGLTKVGLTIMPDAETEHFIETFEWVRSTDHHVEQGGYPLFQSFIPGRMPNDRIVLSYLTRKLGIEDVPYAFYLLIYGNEALQVFIPSVSQDQCVRDRLLTMPPMPVSDASDQNEFGPTRQRLLRLLGAEKVVGDTLPVKFHFDNITME